MSGEYSPTNEVERTNGDAVDASLHEHYLSKILRATGDDRSSEALWRALLRHVSQADVESALELLDERGEKVRNRGAWLNRVLHSALRAGL